MIEIYVELANIVKKYNGRMNTFRLGQESQRPTEQPSTQTISSSTTEEGSSEESSEERDNEEEEEGIDIILMTTRLYWRFHGHHCSNR
jgi:hypothetical protein